MPSIAVLLTVHNRKPKTLRALTALFAQQLPPETTLKVYLVDDGSTDGTSISVNKLFPQVNLLQGDGNLYWCGGMRLAFCKAMQQGFDHYLWLNDDTSLLPKALIKLLETSIQLREKNIIVGSIQDPETNQLTYGGVARLRRWRPLKFTPITPEEIPLPVETMNGNCVLIPQAVVQKVGNLDSAFTHGMGDFDYGLRARALGIGIYITEGYCGYCQRNPPEDKKLPLDLRLKKLISPHGLPLREWAIFSRRYAGPLLVPILGVTLFTSIISLKKTLMKKLL